MKPLLSLLLSLSVLCATTMAQANEFKVRYVGGSVASNVKPDDWGIRSPLLPI